MKFGVLGGGRRRGCIPGYSNPISLGRRGCRECFPCSRWCRSPATPTQASQVGVWRDPAKSCSACRELWNKMGAEDCSQCLQSANALWILGRWGACSVFSLREVPSVCSSFHGHVFPSSVLSMIFVIEKQLCVAPCSLCAISFPWCSSFPVLPCPHLFQGLNLSAKGYGKPS